MPSAPRSTVTRATPAVCGRFGKDPLANLGVAQPLRIHSKDHRGNVLRFGSATPGFRACRVDVTLRAGRPVAATG